MSTLFKLKKTQAWQVEYTLAGETKRISLGKINKTNARSVQMMIDKLVEAKDLNVSTDRMTREWVKGIGDGLRRKLSRAGLIDERPSAAFDDFTQQYIDRHKVKQSTKDALHRSRRYLVAYFKSRDIARITIDDALNWHDSIEGEYAPATVARAVGHARQFMNAAKKAGLIDENPFIELNATVKTNPDRRHYITEDVTYMLIKNAPDDEWRLLLALLRWGGLRCPTDIYRLRWTDLINQKNKETKAMDTLLRVHSDKTDATRYLNLKYAPQILDFMRPLRRDSGLILPTLCQGSIKSMGQNWSNYMKSHLLPLCGLRVWPNLFINFRKSCATDLANRTDISLMEAATFMGHSSKVMQANYYMPDGMTGNESMKVVI